MNWTEYYFEFCSGAYTSVINYILLPLKVFFIFFISPTIKATAFCFIAVLQATICWILIASKGVAYVWYRFKIIYPTLDYWIVEPTLERLFAVIESYINGVIQIFIKEPSDFLIYKVIKPLHLHLSESKYTKDRWEYLDDLKLFLKKAKLVCTYLYHMGFIPFIIGYKVCQDKLHFVIQMAAYFLGPIMKILATCVTPDDFTFSWYYRFKYMLRTSRIIFTKVKYIAFYPIHTPPGKRVEENGFANDLYRLGTLPIVVTGIIMMFPICKWFKQFMKMDSINTLPYEFVDLSRPRVAHLLADYPAILYANWEWDPFTDAFVNLWHYKPKSRSYWIIESVYLEIAWWLSW